MKKLLSIIFVSLLLSGCGSSSSVQYHKIPPADSSKVSSEQEANHQKATGKSTGSSGIDLQNIKQTCLDFGYQEGTEKLADCMKEVYLKQIRNQSQTTSTTTTSKSKIDPSVWDDILGVSRGILGGKSSSSSSSVSCFKINERTSGTNKICSYNCMGSEVTRNIRSTQICPISIKN